MERKNMVLLTVIAVATLLVAVVGATFAYFTATISKDEGYDENQGKTDVTAGSVASTTVVGKVANGAGSFSEEATSIYPGHKEVAGLMVTVTDENNASSHIQIVWSGENNFTANKIKLTAYRASSDIDTSDMKCEKKTGIGENNDEGSTTFYEECPTFDSKITQLGTAGTPQLLDKKTVSESDPIVLYDDKTVTGSAGGTKYYYYVVAEYVNDDDASEGTASQNDDFGKTLTGQISVRLAP